MGTGEDMKKALTRSRLQSELYYFRDGTYIDGPNPNMRGNCSGLYGDCSGLFGNCTGLSGDCTGLVGDLDECEISYEERERGINIKDLIDENTGESE